MAIPPIYFSYFLISLFGLFITHIYRYFLIKTKWLNLPILKLIPRIIAACIIQTLTLLFITYVIDSFFFEFDNFAQSLLFYNEFSYGTLFSNLTENKMQENIIGTYQNIFTNQFFSNWRNINPSNYVIVKLVQTKCLDILLYDYLFHCLNKLN